MSDGYGSTRATTTWISSDGTVTNHDQDTEMGFWVRLFHNECDRSASLEREIERLQQVADDLANHLRGYVCHCQMSKCKCGYDDVMDAYEAVRGE